MNLKQYCCFLKDEGLNKIQVSNKKNSRDYPWEMYTLKELLRATNNFHQDNKIGEGGFGSVYFGRTNSHAYNKWNLQIAVKRLKTMTAKAEMEFAVEVEVLGRVRHQNLLGLRGFYAGGDERLIVYDYMPNHSLLTHLHGPLAKECQLDWPRRMSIAIGAAEGLAYLHHESTPHIIHRDIKASNVLLDPEFQAKVADFGFAKLVPDGGVKRDIVQWVTPYVNKGLFNNIADPKLKGKFDLEQLKNVTTIALRCTDSSADKRPSMKEVVDWLKNGVGSTWGEENIPTLSIKNGDEGNDKDDKLKNN
ncbi:hypothetical protein JHK87_025152 [Glycine soja]|nr:hypothetical protein JHK87_025152 [Glycine soja]